MVTVSAAGGSAGAVVDKQGRKLIARFPANFFLAAIFGLGLLLIIACGGSKTDLSTSTFDSEKAFAHVRALAVDIGTRPAGTAAEAEAADYIAEQLAAYGYQAEQQPFSFAAFIDLGTTLEIISPEGRPALSPLPMQRRLFL